MRAIERKRPPLMSPRRWLLLGIAAVVAMGVWVGLYFRDIQSPYWSEMGDAEQIALATGKLTSIEQMYKHTWEDTTWIAKGLNEAMAEIYLFHRQEELLFAINSTDVVSIEKLRSVFKNENPDTKIISASPGIFRGSPVWELFFSRSVNGKKRYFYHFYSFDLQGTFIESYQLPAKTGP